MTQPSLPAADGGARARWFAVRVDAPVVLGFCGLCLVAFLAQMVAHGASDWVSGPSELAWERPGTYVRLVTQVLGHRDFDHLGADLALLLVLGPSLEHRNGSWWMVGMILATAVATGVVNAVLFDEAAMGSSGVVFAMILCNASSGWRRPRGIPLSVLLVAAVFLGREIAGALTPDRVSQTSHIVGAVVGGVAGYWLERGHRRACGDLPSAPAAPTAPPPDLPSLDDSQVDRS